VAGSVAAVQQGLREAARDRGGDDLRGDEQADATQVGASGVMHSRLGFASAKLPLGSVSKEGRAQHGAARDQQVFTLGIPYVNPFVPTLGTLSFSKRTNGWRRYSLRAIVTTT
jgi:hypothetical protein